MTYKPSPECFDAANAASGGKLSKADIDDAFEAVAAEKDRLKAAGKSDRMAERLTAFVEARAERTKIAAALQKRHAALNILVADRLQGAIASLTKQGLKPHQALLAIMEGTQKGVAGGRASVDAMKAAFKGRYIGDMLAQMQREMPHLEAMLMNDPAFDRDVMREMMELREGGAPGVTKNKDAQYAAKIFATYAEMSRVELNRLGASIGKLEGWAGAQTHDDTKMMAAGKQAWVDAIRPLLDTERTFAGAQSEAEIRDILEEVYDTIITGISGKPIERGTGRVNPASMAKSLGKSRVLHFKDADSVLAYRNEFGYGNTISAIINHQMKAADMAATMETFGPNPEIMLLRITDKMKQDIRSDPKMSPADKNKAIESLKTDGGGIRAAFDIMSGLATRPVNNFWAKIGSETRAVQAMSKLGGAVISSVPADIITTAIASQFRGGGFLRGLTDSLGGIMKGRPKGEQKEISYLLGEGFDALIGHINSAAAGHDMPLGMMSRLQERFFKWNGMTWWDTAMRSVATRGVAAEMGMRAETAFADLPANYRHVLSLHGIDEERWNIIRKAEGRLVDGRNYITGDLMRGLSDDDVKALVAGDLAKADLALAERQAARKAKTAQEKEWVENRSLKLAAHMGRTEARLEDALARLSGKREAGMVELQGSVKALKQRMQGFVDSLKAGDETARMTGRKEGKATRDISALNKDIADLNRAIDKAGKEKLSDMFGDWAEREAELKEFSDRMDRYGKAREAAEAADVAGHADRLSAIHDRARFDLEMRIRSFVADETRYGMLQTDARSRRTTTQGLRPGTFTGEAIRYIAQFKSFPIAFTQRVLGRAAFGFREGARGEQAAHIGTLIAGLGVAGYAAMTAKDMVKGNWPPRDPKDPKVLLAAFQQGGALGIYGDYLFAQSSRFGSGPLETIAGPTIGTAADIIKTGLTTRDYLAGKLEGGKAASPAADWVKLLQGNVPFANLAYVKPALDYLIMNGVRDWATPGHTAKAARQRFKDYGQTTWGIR